MLRLAVLMAVEATLHRVHHWCLAVVVRVVVGVVTVVAVVGIVLQMLQVRLLVVVVHWRCKLRGVIFAVIITGPIQRGKQDSSGAQLHCLCHCCEHVVDVHWPRRHRRSNRGTPGDKRLCVDVHI